MLGPRSGTSGAPTEPADCAGLAESILTDGWSSGGYQFPSLAIHQPSPS